VKSLNKTGKYNQSEALLGEAKRKYQDILDRGGRTFFHYQNEVACTERLAGHPEESEMVLRDLLRFHESSMSPNRRINIIRELGEILYQTNRLEEATSWFEQEFAVLLDNVGLENPLTKISCKRVGLCYSELGRCDEAIEHFERMIERLHNANPQSIHDRRGYIQEIKGWMQEVDDMRIKDWEMHLQEFEDSVSDDTPTEE
jgi:tetratricopeptide (TPR) repeat protein